MVKYNKYNGEYGVMNKKIFDYLNRIGDKPFAKNGGVFVEDRREIRELRRCHKGVNRVNFFNYLMGDDLMVVKSNFQDYFTNENIMEFISGKYFNSIGVPSVEAYPILIEQMDPVTNKKEMFPSVATHNLLDIPVINVELAIDVVFDYVVGRDREHCDEWEILTNKIHKERFLQIMTEDCFNLLVNLFLADRLGTYKDRHGYNYFFYRRTPFGKWEGVIAIDNERSRLAETSRLKVSDESKFEHLINGYSNIFTPLQHIIQTSHKDSINKINKLIDDGKMSDSQILTIKRALAYPYADNMKKICDNYELDCGKMYDLSARLWEYNQENLIV